MIKANVSFRKHAVGTTAWPHSSIALWALTATGRPTHRRWCLFYVKDAKTVVSIWAEEFGRMSGERRVAFLYLANHILQVRLRLGLDTIA